LNPFPQPSSGQDGWAHYAEQMILDEGFHAEKPGTLPVSGHDPAAEGEDSATRRISNEQNRERPQF